VPRADGAFGRADPSGEPLPTRARLAAAAILSLTVRVAMAARDSAALRGRKRPFTIQVRLVDPPVTGLYPAASPFGAARAFMISFGIEELRKPQLPFAAGSHAASAVSALPHRS